MELTFTPPGDPDPKLIALGRQRARETFEAEQRSAPPHHST